jgi:queuosine precursor transporter
MKTDEKIYIILCTIFSVFTVVNNLIYQKFVKLDLGFYIFELSAGAILYPVSYQISDLIAEFYGREKAKFCVILSLFINITVVFFIFLIDLLPSTSWSKINSETFHNIFGFYFVALSASLFASYISQRLDVYLYLLLKDILGEKYISARNILSTSISLMLDTIVVISILVFFKILEFENFYSLLIGSYSWKLFFTLISSPIFLIMVKLISVIRTKS